MKFDALENQHWSKVQSEYEGWNRKVVCYCTECGEPIYENEEVYNFGGGDVIHTWCLAYWALQFRCITMMEDPSEL